MRRGQQTRRKKPCCSSIAIASRRGRRPSLIRFLLPLISDPRRPHCPGSFGLSPSPRPVLVLCQTANRDALISSSRSHRLSDRDRRTETEMARKAPSEASDLIDDRISKANTHTHSYISIGSEGMGLTGGLRCRRQIRKQSRLSQPLIRGPGAGFDRLRKPMWVVGMEEMGLLADS